MSYTLKRVNDGHDLEIMPNCPQPLIYHDTCLTWHLAEENDEDRKKFLDAFSISGGTLCLTVHTINEILTRVRGGWYAKFQEYCDLIGDRFVFLLFNPFRVIEREPHYETHELDCVVDISLIKDAFLSFYLQDSRAPNLRCIFDYFYDYPHKRNSLLSTYRGLLRELSSAAIDVRNQYQSNKERRKSAKQALQETFLDKHYTRYFTRYVINEIAKNREWNLDSNEAADFFHAIVPISWCDFVVVDKGWRELAHKAYRHRKHSTRVFKISELDSYIKTLKYEGPLINRAYITKKWMYALKHQGNSPFDQNK